MDFIHGANLEQELRDYVQLTGKTFPPDVLIRDMLQVLDILVYLHSMASPVIHRDIKPANLIREFKTGKVVLVDFGLARQVCGTQTQTAVGTLGYSPLEQFQGQAEPRSDIYALGITMNHLLSGQAPVPLGTPPLRQKEPSLDARLAAVVD
jgi:serine/threonine protein kinase